MRRDRGGRAEVAIAYVGGGSRDWAVKLMGDLALSERLSGELRLYDLDFAAASHNAALGTAIFGRPESRGGFVVRALPGLDEALAGADFVVVSIEPGPTEARYADLEIPARYGIPQSVGDTVGPGGLLRALRAIPLMIHIGRKIAELCPGARVINYTNPMTLCVAALYDAAPSIVAWGCCHEVFAVRERTALFVAKELDLPMPPPRAEIEADIAGVNHFTFARSLRWCGEDFLPLLRRRADELVAANGGRFPDGRALARRRRDREEWFDCEGYVGLEFLRRFGVLGAAGDRHLAEFVPWFLRDEDSLNAYGVPLTPYAWRIARRDAARPGADEIAARPLAPSGEEGVAQIEALLGFGKLISNLNLPNRGQWADAPSGHVVETNVCVDGGSIAPLAFGSLPPAVAALESRIMAEQTLVLEAAKARDFGMALEALLLDPLVHLAPSEAEAMLREMVGAAAPWLEGWSIP